VKITENGEGFVVRPKTNFLYFSILLFIIDPISKFLVMERFLFLEIKQTFKRGKVVDLGYLKRKSEYKGKFIN